jgi:signal transduction histidine kinase
MRLTFRKKLMTIVGIAAFAFALIVGSGVVITRRVEQRLRTIQDRLLPKLELEPQLEGQFDKLRRGFQDAVAARDVDGLGATSELKRAFVERLEAARDALDPDEVAALRTSLDAYYDTALRLSRRLIDGETGEELVDAISDMQAKQAATFDLLRKTASVDREALTQAFAATEAAEATARSYQLWISVVCFGLVMALSIGFSRSLLRSLSQLGSGLLRFGAGDFAKPIAITTDDELGDLGRRANQMAASLERAGREQRAAEEGLQRANRELEAFSYSVAHDLRAPLRGINGFSKVLVEDCADKLDDEGKHYLARISAAADRMGHLIDALLALSRVTRSEFRTEEVNLSQLADAVAKQLRTMFPERSVQFVSREGALAVGDPILLRALLENLLGNAWKFTAGASSARIEFACSKEDGGVVYSVTDNGAGFDMTYADKLFAPFQRLHSDREFAGTGIGLATVQRIVNRHGGRVWAEGAPGKGATFHFTLGKS